MTEEQRSENLNDIEEEKDNVKSLVKPKKETIDIRESGNSQRMNCRLQSMSMYKTPSMVTELEKSQSIELKNVLNS